MIEATVNFVAEIPEEVKARMSADLAAYEASHGVHVNYQQFSLLLNDRNGNTLGVLNGYTAYAEVYIDDLWVDSNHRNNGYGSLLIKTLENEFLDRGFNNINLVTSAFQAPDFYRKCGFVEEFTRLNVHNPKLNKTFFAKFFENNSQTQGLMNTSLDT